MQTYKVQHRTKAELSGIYKIYQTENTSTGEIFTNTALTDVNISFFTSEIHALLGENGAGKSTLVNILSGLIPPSNGIIKIADKIYSFNSPNDALRAGVSIVHQKPQLAENATVLENIIMGAKHNRFFSVLNIKREKEKIEEFKSIWNIDLELNEYVKKLSIEKKFYTAMFSALYRNPAFLILDEPAYVFSEQKRIHFFSALKNECKNKNLGVILITHRVKDAVFTADKISVLKNGKLQGVFLTSDLIKNNNAEDFIKEKIFSKKTFLNFQHNKKNTAVKNKIIFSVLCSYSINTSAQIKKINLQAEAGKVTGVIGFPNSGLEYLEDIISGMTDARHTYKSTKDNFISIRYEDTSIIIPAAKITPALLLKYKIGVIPSDRNYRGSNPALTIEEVLNSYNFKKYFFNKFKSAQFAKNLLNKENISANYKRLAGTLSGGQLQRIILARCLAEKPKIIIAAEPACGLDAASTESLMTGFRLLAEDGKIIIILTKEFDTELYKSYFDKVYFLGNEN